MERPEREVGKRVRRRRKPVTRGMEGVVRLAVTGKPFDPTLMVAVATEPSDRHPPQTVLEETLAGYLRQGELLRPAQVKLSTTPSRS